MRFLLILSYSISNASTTCRKEVVVVVEDLEGRSSFSSAWSYVIVPPTTAHCILSAFPQAACLFYLSLVFLGASLIAQLVENLSAMQETQVQYLGWEDRLVTE